MAGRRCIGLLPYSRMVNPPGDAIAQEPTSLLAIPRECLKAMIRECYEVTAILVHAMVDRARTFSPETFATSGCCRLASWRPVLPTS